MERPHKTIMRMIRKLGEDKRANWLGHLAEIVHAYNVTQCAVMGYSPHYLMFGWRPRFPVDLHAHNATQCAVIGYNPHYLMFEWRPRLPVNFTPPPLGAQRLLWEVPLPSVWTNMWQQSTTDWGLPSGKLRPSQWQKSNDRNSTTTKR